MMNQVDPLDYGATHMHHRPNRSINILLTTLIAFTTSIHAETISINFNNGGATLLDPGVEAGFVPRCANLAPGRSFESFAADAFAVPEPHARYGYYQLAHGLGLAGGHPGPGRRRGPATPCGTSRWPGRCA